MPWREAQSWPGVSGKRAGLMLYVSILVELLRSRPALAVWLAALTQALLWTLVPVLFYGEPPGNLATTIAIGHEFPLGTYLGPPLAFWLLPAAVGVPVTVRAVLRARRARQES